MRIILSHDRATEILGAFESQNYVPPADLLEVVKSRAPAILDLGTLAAWESGLQTRPSRTATPGERGYESYRVAIGGVAFNGDPPPDFAQIPEKIRASWEVAAAAILQKSESLADPASPAHISELNEMPALTETTPRKMPCANTLLV